MDAHVIGRQTLEIDVDTEDLALALRPRLSELNRKRLLPALEAVLDEFDVPGRRLRLGRIEVDLGWLPASDFEEQVGPRLKDALRAALRRALEEPRGKGGSRRTAEQARLEALHHYLLHGTLPFWAAHDAAFTCQAGVLSLVEDDPAGLLALLRRVGHAPPALERLAAQLDESTLRRVVAVLEPRHAGLIVSYVSSLRAVQQAERIVPLAEPGFSRLVWFLTQAYLVRDAGSTFNRLSFLRSLVRGLATREGLDYELLLRLLQRALAHARGRLARHASFPAAVAALVRELERREPGAERGPGVEEAVAPAADDDAAPPSATEADARPPTPDALRRLGARYARAERLAAFLRSGRPSWRGLLDAQPGDDARLLDALAGLSPAWRRALLDGAPSERRRALERALRALPGRRVRALLRRMLPGLRRGTLAQAFDAHARNARDPLAFHASALLAALDGDDLDLEAWAQAETTPAETARPDLSRWSAGDLRAALIERLRGTEPRAGAGSRSVELLRALARGHPRAARDLVRALGSSPDVRRALLCRVPPAALDELLDACVPASARALLALRGALRRLPSPRRPRAADAWQALADAALRADGSQPTAAFYANVLRATFGGPPPADVREALGRELGAAHAGVADLAALLEALALAPPRADQGDARAGSRPDEAAGAPAGALDTLARDVLAWLDPDAPASLEPDEALAAACDELLDRAPADLVAALRRRVSERRCRERWASQLSEASLARVVALLEPRRHAALLAGVEVLAGAWGEIAPPGHPARFGRRALWTFVLTFLAETPAASRSLERLADALCAHLAQGYRAALPAAQDVEELGARLLEHAERLARRAGDARLLGVIERERGRLQARFAGRFLPSRAPAPARQARATARAAERASRARPGDEAASGLGLIVGNAGLVLVAAYLPRFFDALGLLAPADDGRPRLRDDEALTRAVHLLQFLVDGSTDTPEPALALNKVLCGATPADVVAASIEPTAEERDTCEGLLRAVIAHWTIIAGTSVEGLRETFLRREGRLEDTDDGWRLTVQRKTLDVLVDQLPWSFSVVRHGFMPRPLYTRW